MSRRKTFLESLGLFLPILLLSIILAFPRSFSEFKLFLIFLLVFHLFAIVKLEQIKIPQTVAIFYVVQIIIGLLVSLNAFVNANEMQSIVDGLRIHVIFSFLISFLLVYMAAFGAREIIHKSVLIGGVIISVTNIFFAASSYFGLSVFSDSLKDELSMRVGFHEGYVQLTSHAIGMLFFIIPYLLTFVLIKKDKNQDNFLIYIVLVLTVMCAVISGRRALWIAVAMAPIVIILGLVLLNKWEIINYKAIAVLMLFSSCFFLTLFFIIDFSYTLSHLFLAFSEDDLRSVQREYLINKILGNFWFGSGFGGRLDIIRSYDSPWLFELTYHQKLFNYGIFLFAAYVLSLVYIFLKAIKTLRHFIDRNSICLLAITFGVLMLFVGSYSNPYLGSFDFLLVVGLFVLMAGVKSDKHISTKTSCDTENLKPYQVTEK